MVNCVNRSYKNKVKKRYSELRETEDYGLNKINSHVKSLKKYLLSFEKLAQEYSYKFEVNSNL